MPTPVLQFKRGIFSNLPGLRAGEPGFTTDSYELYVGIDSTTQNNKFFGSHRYWTRETTTTGSGVNLVEGSNNGSDYITLASPGTVGAAVTYYFPASPIASNVLTTDANGVLSWTAALTALNVGNLIIGIGTFTNNVGFTTTTDNTLGDENTGAVQLDGGMGIAKNLTVKQNLHVGGYAEFVGVVTFKGGTINIGDNNTDDINVGGEFISGLVPNIDNTHDLGITTQRWRTLNVVNVDTTNLTGTAGTITTFNSTNGTITNFNSTNVSVSGLSTFTGAIDANGNLDVDGYTELDDVNVSGTLSVTGISTFTGAIDANGGADISGGETTLSSATVSDLTAGRVVLAGTSGSLNDSANLTFGAGGLIVGAGGINVTGVSTFSTDLVVGGDIRVNGNDIQASDGNANITLTSNTLTTFAGDIRVNGNDIQSSTGVVAITLADNDVTVADDLTIQGNLYVNGSTTQVNTASLTVEDRTIDLGIVNGAAPASATTWDLGVLFNYNSSGAKKSAVIWEHGDSRFKFASVLGADTNGTDVNTPQLTVTTFAPIEIGQLWVTDCAGTSQVISCTGSTRNLENITVDAGTFV